jgi:ubiquinone/menaquinone biosynthesis C-methylase UbiE
MNREANSIYEDGRYLKNNETWHTEDSSYKASFVIETVQKNNVTFESCADIGCGAGLITELLARHYPSKSFSGYELSPDCQLFLAQRTNLPNLRFYVDNLLSKDVKYDLVVCLDVFEHVEDYYAFLRVLKKKGHKFVFNIPLDMSVIKLVFTGIEHSRNDYGHLHYFNYFTAVETLKDCGYEVKYTKLSAAFLKVPPRNIRQLVLLPFRLVSVMLGKRVAAMLFGGVSLIVYAE